jgi:hypothetical protein
LLINPGTTFAISLSKSIQMLTYEITKSITTGNMFIGLSSWERTKENKDLVHEKYFKHYVSAEIYINSHPLPTLQPSTVNP